MSKFFGNLATMAQVRYTRNLFLRGICIIYMFAFLGFYVQIPGLYGDNGVLPARVQLDFSDNIPLLHKFAQKPTLLWFAPYLGLNAEYMMDVVALCGALISFYCFISQKYCISPVFALLWSLYFSLYQIGQTFMWFQWDLLLLEVGFLCIIIAPLWYFKHGNISTPSDSVTFWTIRWVLFRLLFSTGIIKFTSGCPIWWSLKGLTIHFESMVLPTPLAWYAHHLPEWFLKLTMVFSHVTELLVPFLFFFLNRRVKIIAFFIQLFLQANIIATGNFNYLNLLVVCLCISLLDDKFFYRKKKDKQPMSVMMNYLSLLVTAVVYIALLVLVIQLFKLRITDDWTIESEIGITKEYFDQLLPKILGVAIYVAMISLGFTISEAIANSAFESKNMKKNLTTTFVTFIYSAIVSAFFALSIVPFTTLHPYHNITLPTELKKISNKFESFHVVNSYGIFRRMTGVEGRPEIIIEGSNHIDGPWREYEFLYKPGNVNNSLPFVAPYQPRLDWQMWFAALGTYHQNPWLISLAYRLLNGQPEVLSLMNNVGNPFKNAPPKFIRANLYHYHYSTGTSKAWWTRELVREYFPIYSLDHAPLMEYLVKMRIIEKKPLPKVSNVYFKLILDTLRSIFGKCEGSLLLWSVFTAGCAIIMTGYNPMKKATREKVESTKKGRQHSASSS